MFVTLLLSISALFNTNTAEKAVVTGRPFRLFYVFTSAVLFCATALLGLQEAFGKNIICRGNTAFNEEHEKAVEQYCWVTGTLPAHLDCKSADPTVKHIYDNKRNCHCGTDGRWYNRDSGDACDTVHSYYQWIPYLLLFLGCVFYFPKLVWDYFEEGKMTQITKSIKAGTINKQENVDNVAKNVAKYIQMSEGGHVMYGFGYILAHFLNLAIVVMAFWMTNRFFDGYFIDLGAQWLDALHDETKRSSVILEMIFPRRVSCNFKTHGLAGTIQESNHECVLAPNAFAEKVFCFLWFWFCALAIIGVYNIIEIIVMMIPSTGIRKWFLAKTVWSTKIKSTIKVTAMEREIARLNFGQFIFLYFCGRNVGVFVFEKIIQNLANGIMYKRTNSQIEPASAPPSRPPSFNTAIQKADNYPTLNVEMKAMLDKCEDAKDEEIPTKNDA